MTWSFTTAASLVRPTDKTHRPPRITFDRFRSILRRKPSPAYPDAQAIWDLFIAAGIDPAFALGHYWVESNHGTSGFAVETKSWGNSLYSRVQTPGAARSITKTVDGHNYTYAAYDSVLGAVPDYIGFLNWYAANTDSRYGDSSVIWGACARWAGNALGSAGHEKYVSIVLSEINDDYEFVPGAFVETGDTMIQTGKAAITTKARIPVQNGTALYRGTAGDLLKYAAFGDGRAATVGMCKLIGPAGGAWSDPVWPWAAIVVGIRSIDPAGVLVYVKDVDPAKIVYSA